MTDRQEKIIKKMGAAVALLVALVALTTAAKGGLESWLMPRREVEMAWNRQLAAEALHAVRDSARQESINRSLKYLKCRLDNGPRACAHLAN